MTKEQVTIEILKLSVSLLTPILVVIFGFIISRKIETTKINVLKEKEWQVKWAELFLKHATDFNDNISTVVCSLFSLQGEVRQEKIAELVKIISTCNSNLAAVDWNIRNYAQFPELYKDEVLQTQEELMQLIKNLISNRRGSFEDVRLKQFQYNSAVRKAHNDILASK